MGKASPAVVTPFPGTALKATIAERAQRVRDLVNATRLLIVQIGRELIAAKAVVGHGQWLDWLEDEFGWSDRTARSYMSVAEAFKSARLSDLPDLTIDATALYALAAPAVPQEARDEAVARAEDGEHITKAEAEEMIAKARVELEVSRQTIGDGQVRSTGLADEGAQILVGGVAGALQVRAGMGVAPGEDASDDPVFGIV